MGLTKTDILARVEELKKTREQAIANLNALGGAIQDCEFWVARLEEMEKAAADPS